ncbi:MAG TPA: hypothetical protein VGI60_08485 [Chthoniobacterales bacterium]|jgi:hypothetical protein
MADSLGESVPRQGEERRTPSPVSEKNGVWQATSAKHGETAAHRGLKQLAFLWAQENGYRLAAFEVSLPKCRYRADVAAYRPRRSGALGHTAVFECKQSTPDLRRDDCRRPRTVARLESVYRRQQILEKHLRVHYPTLRTGETLFPEWDDWDFAAIEHCGYRRVIRELTTLQNQLRDGRKFERLAHYCCANLLYLVLPNELLREAEVPLGWGLLVAHSGALRLQRKPVWHESPEVVRLKIVEKIAATATRQLNRQYHLAPQTPWSSTNSSNRATAS